MLTLLMVIALATFGSAVYGCDEGVRQTVFSPKVVFFSSWPIESRFVLLDFS